MITVQYNKNLQMEFKYYHTVPDDTVNYSILAKMILLSNNIVQWEGYDYSEALFQFSVISGHDAIVYFSIDDEHTMDKPVLARVSKIINSYASSGNISKEDMQLANKLWSWLKAQAVKQEAF
jgi:hypothetical protein